MKLERTYKLNEIDSLKFNDITKNSIKCSCGHSVLVSKNKALCTHCGKWVFKNKTEEFKFRLMEKIGKKYE